MNSQKLANELKEVIEKGLEDLPVPYVKGNSIRIGANVVRTSKHGNLVYNLKDNKKIAHTFSKTAAVAIAKTCQRNTQYLSEILELDNEVNKHFNDALFFKHSLRRTKDPMRYDILETRLDISMSRAYEAKYQLEQFIF